VLAFAGVLLLTQPWTIGGNDAARTWAGLAFAAVAGTGWAAYILLTAHVGRSSQGLGGLTVALVVAAATLAAVGGPQAWGTLQVATAGPRNAGWAAACTTLATCALAALLVPLAAYALEMIALRRLDQGVFGVWMAVEPALGGLIGLVMLGQRPDPLQLPGFVLVVLAGIGAERGAARLDTPPEVDVRH
jgi:inner membrane transporter RhtA